MGRGKEEKDEKTETRGNKKKRKSGEEKDGENETSRILQDEGIYW